MRGIAVLDAPSNLGLRPPTLTSVPGCAKAPGALREPDEHAQAEPVYLSVLDLRYPSLSHAELFRRLRLRQSGLVQPFVDAGKQLGAHFEFCGFFLGKEVVEY